MVQIGGPFDLLDEVKRNGGQTGPATFWVGSWMARDGLGGLDGFLSQCATRGIQRPLLFFWFWGDDISTAAITNGVKDRYQGVWKTKQGGYDLAKAIGSRAKAAGVEPIVAIEHEFAQNGLETDRSAFAPYWLECARIIKAECPGARIVFTVPIWEDEVAIAKVYPDLIAKADMVGSQTLLFAPRHGSREFINAGANLLAAFNALRGMASGKPACIVDLGFSSYGGPYAPAHPFSGGTGNGNDALQAQALQSIADRVSDMRLEFVVYRALRDNPTFNVANYGGYAERHVGVMRGDGTRKPAYATLMQMANIPGPSPRPRCRPWLRSGTPWRG